MAAHALFSCVRSYSMRSSVVACLAAIVTSRLNPAAASAGAVRAAEEDAAADGAGGGAPHDWEKTRDALLDVLQVRAPPRAGGAVHASAAGACTRLIAAAQERIRDVNAFTRVAVLRAWGTICERGCIPLGRYQAVTAICVDRCDACCDV